MMAETFRRPSFREQLAALLVSLTDGYAERIARRINTRIQDPRYQIRMSEALVLAERRQPRWLKALGHWLRSAGEG